MAGYSKLFSSIVTSSVWCEDNTVLRVWIAMLATCDHRGIVEGGVPGFASLCRISCDEMRRALQILSSPDPDSRTPDNDGKRIEAIKGGWRILNYLEYRNRLQEKEGSKSRAMRECRARKKLETDGNALPSVTTCGGDVTLPASASAYAYEKEYIKHVGTKKGRGFEVPE